jgi:hypothetical protein
MIVVAAITRIKIPIANAILTAPPVQLVWNTPTNSCHVYGGLSTKNRVKLATGLTKNLPYRLTSQTAALG